MRGNGVFAEWVNLVTYYFEFVDDAVEPQRSAQGTLRATCRNPAAWQAITPMASAYSARCWTTTVELSEAIVSVG